MPLPASSLSLVRPARCLPTNWEAEFGIYSWFYVRGFVECLAALDRVARAAGRGAVTTNSLNSYIVAGIQAAGAVNWPANMAIGEWDQLSTPQLYRARRQKPQRYDKAALVIAVLHEAARSIAPGFDIFNFPLRAANGSAQPAYGTLTIDPAFWLITGFDRLACTTVTAPRNIGGGRSVPQALLEDTCQDDLTVFNGLSRDRRCTHLMVERTLQHVTRHHATLAGGLTISQINQRLHNGSKTPNNQERVWLEILNQQTSSGRLRGASVSHVFPATNAGATQPANDQDGP